MAIADPRLSKIVSLKRRAAEAQFRMISNHVSALDAQIQQYQIELETNGAEKSDAFAGNLVAAALFTQKLVVDLNNLNFQKVALMPELQKARTELQKIIVSEQVLDEG